MIKKIKRVISFAFALLLALGTLTSCFSGIGDGAMIAGVIIPPTKQTEPADTTAVADTIAKVENVQTTQKEALTRSSVVAQLSEIESCKLFLTVNKEVQSTLVLEGDDAAEVYRLFSEAGRNFSTENKGYNRYNCVTVEFTDVDGGNETFNVGTNDYYMKIKGTTPSIASSGTINGLYNSLVGYLD